MSLFDLSNKVAIVTGSSRGIGKAIAMHMALHGARVVISSRKAESCAAVVAEIAAAGGTAFAHPAHVGHKEELEALVDATIARWGRIDILVCNAATNPHFGPSISIKDEALEKVIHTNLYSNIWLCNLVLPGMAERSDGVVIIISSVAGFSGTSLLGAYALSKAADMQLARNLAVEWGPRNVRVNCIAPGVIRTHFAKALWADPQREAALARRYPLRRIGEPEDVAGIAVMLAARAGRFITGQSIVVDGGGLISGELT
ncbi:MAG: SDR family oxidoreductase [Gammaproteobacteria bacterium]|nr:SDR family oxidoreductase [Gammaproteobacteria bacterium]MBV9316938.1 SDR family oxidoreductase [Gammaproteobacteria bacterium]MBV9727525.1 SDR family oxidoreductase [Gammaproteobacteria bacterium]